MDKRRAITVVRPQTGFIDIVEERTGKPGLDVFPAAIPAVAPVMEVRPRRVGGATYQVPLEVDAHRQFALVTRWIFGAAREQSGKSFAEKLAEELVLPYLGKIRLDVDITLSSDSGEPVVLSKPDCAAAKAFLNLADNCHKFLNPEASVTAG